MKIFLLFFFSIFTFSLLGQDINLLLKEANNFEHQFKDQEALNKYKQVLLVDGNNIIALIKATELSCNIGERLINKDDKRINFETAFSFANRAIKLNTNNADAFCAMAMACGKMTKIETENKKIIAYVNDVKLNADKALKINPNHAKANFIEGKWHYEMINLNWAKRLAIKTFYSQLPPATIEIAIQYFEKCKTIDPYFILNGLMLAKAYQQNNKPSQTIIVLKQVIKMPIRNFDDAALKLEAQKMLQELE